MCFQSFTSRKQQKYCPNNDLYLAKQVRYPKILAILIYSKGFEIFLTNFIEDQEEVEMGEAEHRLKSVRAWSKLFFRVF